MPPTTPHSAQRARTGRRFVVLADDLTSAAEAAGHAAHTGQSASVVLDFADPATLGDAAVWPCVDLDSRDLPPEEAAARHTRVTGLLLARPAAPAVRTGPAGPYGTGPYGGGYETAPGRRGTGLYKTMDSSLRGNWPAELAAVMRASGRRVAVVAPACPAYDRRTVGGTQFAGGVPVHRGPAGSDPVRPVTESSVTGTLIAAGFHTSLVDPAGDDLAAALRSALGRAPHRNPDPDPDPNVGPDLDPDPHPNPNPNPNPNPHANPDPNPGPGPHANPDPSGGAVPLRAFVVDATTEEDLARIAAAVHALAGDVVLCGSPGLWEALLPAGAGAGDPRPAGRSGPAGRGGLSDHGDAGDARDAVDPWGPWGPCDPCGPGTLRRALVLVGSLHPTTRQQLARLAATGVPVLGTDELASHPDPAGHLTTLFGAVPALALATPGAVASDPAVAARHLRDLAGLGARCARALPGLGLVLTGGDTARELATALGAPAIRAVGTLAPGIPLGILTGPGSGSRPVVTKAGGFGGPDSLVAAVAALIGSP